MSKVEDKYEVTVRGQYYANRNGTKTQGQYEITLVLGESARKQGFLSVIRKNYLDPILRNQYEDYKRFRTHEIVNVVNLKYRDQPIREIGLMNRKQLVSFIKSKRLKINTNLYTTAADLRAALINYKENRDQFLQVQANKQKRMAPTIAINKAFSQDNPELAKLIGMDVDDVTPDDEIDNPIDDFTNVDKIDFGPKASTISNDDDDDFAMDEDDLEGL